MAAATKQQTRWVPCALFRAGGALLALMLLATPVHAAPSAADKAAAESLFEEGLAAMRRGELESGCSLLERSNTIDPATGTLMYLAECYELSGKTASAWAAFREAEAKAKAAAQSERATMAAERAEQLEARLSHLKVEVNSATSAIAGLRVLRNGAKLEAAAWGVAIAVDPGQSVIEVEAPNYESWRHSVDVQESGQYTVSVPDLVPLPKAALPATAEPKPETRDARKDKREPRDRGGFSGLEIAGLATSAVGLVGMGVGGYFGIEALRQDGEADKNCNAGVCSTQNAATQSQEALRDAETANLLVGIGGGVVLGGLLLYALAPDGNDVGVSAFLSERSAGLVISDDF